MADTARALADNHITALEELRDELRHQADDIADSITEYNDGCPAQQREVIRRDKLKSRADALDTALSLLTEREKMVAVLPIADVLRACAQRIVDESGSSRPSINAIICPLDAFRALERSILLYDTARAAPQPPKGGEDDRS